MTFKHLLKFFAFVTFIKYKLTSRKLSVFFCLTAHQMLLHQKKMMQMIIVTVTATAVHHQTVMQVSATENESLLTVFKDSSLHILHAPFHLKRQAD